MEGTVLSHVCKCIYIYIKYKQLMNVYIMMRIKFYPSLVEEETEKYKKVK